MQVMGADDAADKVEADICRLINDGQGNSMGRSHPNAIACCCVFERHLY